MEYASEDLIREHEGILSGLQILEEMASRLLADHPVEPEDLRAMLDFLVLFADKCHHGKEETMLFPAMEKAGIARENGPIGQMLLEHAEGRELITAMNTSLGSNGVARRGFATAALRYLDLLRSHIEKENTILFPLGDRSIPMTIQSELLQKFEDFEEQVMGPGTHERLHETLHRLRQRYLKPGGSGTHH